MPDYRGAGIRNMDSRTESKAIPLAVDLDGTLISTDLFWESLFVLLRQNPLMIFLVPFWVWKGKAHVKHQIASRIEIDPATLPYREELLDRLKDEQASGRRLVLATGSHRHFAESIAQYLGIFDEVMATDETVNLTSSRKQKALVEKFGDGGFDYAGNSHADLKVFDAARQSIIVAPDKAARDWQSLYGGELYEAPKAGMRSVIKMLRVHQWLKNTLIGVPLILNHDYGNGVLVLACLLAFISFSAAASSIYILNDFFDLALDRKHPTKRYRPFASGALSIPFGIGAMGLLLAISLGAALFLPPIFLAVLAVYLVATTAYSMSLKRMLLIDVLALAGLYTVRVLAGAAATGIPVSFWLISFAVFFFLSLALVKRYVELTDTDIEEGKRIAGRGYRGEDREVIAQAGMASGFAAVLVLALYIDSDQVREMYAAPWMIWPLAMIILYIIVRIWVLARRGEMNDDPVVFLISDWRSLIMIAGGAILIGAAQIFGVAF